jgi:UDP-N-acetylglucosamine--N-acetylmuramyl-(pentapeptide) pyrophosphoryl-undecaprenol N-acetylglucosamine transferase
MHLWISGGGTAGHVYPAFTVLDALDGEADRVTWIGRGAGMEAGLVAARGIPFVAVDAAPMVGVGFMGRLRGAVHLLRGTAQVWRQIGLDRPDVLLVTGGYVSVPAALAAWLRRVPLAIYLPDMRPGRAVSLIARLADRLLVTDERARAHLPVANAKVQVTGYPVRRALREMDREKARDELNLTASEPLVLIFGGSQGARRLNEAVIQAAPTLLNRCRLLHVTGALDVARVSAARDGLALEQADRWQVSEYLDAPDMAIALHAADLAVCRAGASVLGELPTAGLPAILIPLPIARGHQDANAAVLVDAGAARVVDDRAWTGERMVNELDQLLSTPEELAAMRTAARALARSNAAEAIATALQTLASAQPLLARAAASPEEDPR